MLRSLRSIGLSDWIAAALVLALGVFVILEGRSFRLGTLASIGPGFFPFILGWALVICGLGILLVEGPRNGQAPLPVPALRPVFALTAALIAFGVLVERFGFAPAVFAATFLATFFTEGGKLAGRLLLALCITLGSVLLFRQLLGLPLEVFTW